MARSSSAPTTAAQLMGNCNAPDWDGQAMPRPPSRTRQLIDPMAAFQMVHILEGVVERGTATVLRDLDRPLFGKTGTTTGPTNVWFVGGTPDVVAGVYLGFDQPRSWAAMPRAGGSRRRSSSNGPRSRSKACPRRRSSRPRASAGSGSTARRARRCSATFPTTEDPKSSVIWEAFQPQTEPRRAYRHSRAAAEDDQAAPDAQARGRDGRRARALPQAAPAATPAPLPSQNTTG